MTVTNWILKVTVGTLACIVVAVVLVLMGGLFNPIVDNDKIFEIIGPAFSTVIGAFVGLLGGISLNKADAAAAVEADAKAAAEEQKKKDTAE
jgi:uncharacterized membrane protein YraQ (UPF0718 family)